MPDLIIILLTLLIGTSLGAFLGIVIQRKLNKSQLLIHESNIRTDFSNKYREKELENEKFKSQINYYTSSLEASKEDLKRYFEMNNELLKENEKLKTQERINNQHFTEKIALLTEAKDSLKKDFELLANKIFEEKSTKFKETNQENITNLLNPMKIQLEEFKNRINQVYDSENKDRASLRSEIINLRSLNESLNKEAQNLTNALKRDPKKQGNWGEMKLERVLEDSGLDKNIEYFTQAHYVDNDNKNKYPDVVIKLPEERDIIIDSKMSLTAYERFTSATNEIEKEQALKEHLSSVKKHVTELAAKEYHKLNGINTVSHVLMFIPIESAYLLALENDNQIFIDAMDKNVMVVGPSTLMYVLRTIKQIWRSEYQTRNVLEIAEEGGKMYDKLCMFVNDLEKIGKNISDLSSNYETSMKKLSTGNGNLINKAEKMKALGAKAKKQLTLTSKNEEIDTSEN